MWNHSKNGKKLLTVEEIMNLLWALNHCPWDTKSILCLFLNNVNQPQQLNIEGREEIEMVVANGTKLTLRFCNGKRWIYFLVLYFNSLNVNES